MARVRTDDAAMSTNPFIGQPPTATHQSAAKITPECCFHSKSGFLGGRSSDPSVAARSVSSFFPLHEATS